MGKKAFNNGLSPEPFLLSYTHSVFTHAELAMCVCLSVSVWVCVTRRYCVKNAKGRITQTTPRDSPGTLVFWRQESLVDVWTTPPPCRFCQISLNGAAAIRASEKSWISVNRKSTMRFPSSHRWTLCVTPNSSKGWLKRGFFLQLALPFISWLQVIVDNSNLVCRLNIASFSLQMTNRPWNGRGHVTRPILNF